MFLPEHEAVIWGQRCLDEAKLSLPWRAGFLNIHEGRHLKRKSFLLLHANIIYFCFTNSILMEKWKICLWWDNNHVRGKWNSSVGRAGSSAGIFCLLLWRQHPTPLPLPAQSSLAVNFSSELQSFTAPPLRKQHNAFLETENRSGWRAAGTPGQPDTHPQHQMPEV